MLQPGSDRQIFRKMQLGVYGDTEWAKWLKDRGILERGFRLPADIPIKFHSVQEYLNSLAQEVVCENGGGVGGEVKQTFYPMFSIGTRLNSSVVTSLLRMKSDNDRKLPQ